MKHNNMPVKNKVGLLSFFSASYQCEHNDGVSSMANYWILNNIDKLLFGIPDPSMFRVRSGNLPALP